MKTEIIEHIATAKDGGSMLLQYRGQKYLLDQSIGSELPGRLLTYVEREPVSAMLDSEIRAAFTARYNALLPEPTKLLKKELTTGEESGSYKYVTVNTDAIFEAMAELTKPSPDPLDIAIDKAKEEASKTSLYNLLDHSELDLDRMITIITHFIGATEHAKETFKGSRESAFAWFAVFQQAKKEVNDRDSQAWADKTAKEIKETLKQK